MFISLVEYIKQGRQKFIGRDVDVSSSRQSSTSNPVNTQASRLQSSNLQLLSEIRLDTGFYAPHHNDQQLE